ncbi:Predicted unusual protein kinase regulating ubiquinone biosynthesis, AarF/ABC1/UbiB family [Kaistia soli DSM 19436]|uniref:Predicted unusual protein kinase regulating ubiquinone biosynthesis, AarF/ABC1/UbiB family n=1 Tax=Kaistia soli DSM 19436 TaxID=1122133 RepID=A0A1M5M3H4_9HYPH|nr:AarF/UbiB family protein [Kaistia soli]SHG71766.1 Predicted unusual protein kinase regulating ubiquinone biosynthesis, AarF/ABC1/UbiB family [Kaistia soli DSM 19436]
MSDSERNRLSGRLSRYARVGVNVGGVAAKVAGARLFGTSLDKGKNAGELAAALGGLKGPLMKVGQILSTVPDLVPPEYAAELSQLQSNAPPMGWPFVRRRMQAELGPDWEQRFGSFDRQPAAAASLGQVHRAVGKDGRALAVKLQYPDMQSAVEADLTQLRMLFSVYRRIDASIDTSQILEEISARIREELDYGREARHALLYKIMLDGQSLVRVPEVEPNLSTQRLLSLTWLEGGRLLDFRDRSLEERNRIATAMFQAWWSPFAHYGVIHGDPHLGNYTVFEEDGVAGGINLLDYGCIRIFPPVFVDGVVNLFHGLLEDDRARVVAAYESWGFVGLSNELIDALNIWARFIYAPLLDDRVRTIADGVAPAEYGRREAFRVHQVLKEKGPVTVPREFVFMDRAAIGLGAVFLHLRAELNFHRLFMETLDGFDARLLGLRQQAALGGVGLA